MREMRTNVPITSLLVGFRTDGTRIGLGGRRSLLMVFLAFMASTGAQAQVDHNDNQFVYTNVVTNTLPSYLTASPNLIFNSNSGLFDFENVSAPTKPTMFVRKAPAQHGMSIFDNNPADNAVLAHGLNLEMYNITNLLGGGTRAGIRVHVDPSNTAPANLYGVEIGNHGPATTGLIVATYGANAAQTSGVGIQSLAKGFASILSTEGDPVSSPVPTVGLQFNHYSTGNIMTLYQMNSQMTGDFLFGNASNGGTGALLGNFLNFNVNWVSKFRVDAGGNLFSVGSVWSQKGSYYGSNQNAAVFYDGTNLNLQPRLVGAGQVVVTAGSVVIPEIRANSGTRFVCVDTTGKIISQTTPCSGT
jgi:hypothetical protein